jgi:uncharacterized coiled-coil DUF342 family protein
MEAIMRTNTTKLMDLQEQVIAKAKEVIDKQQEKIDALEKQVAELERRLAMYESESEETVEEIEPERTVRDEIFINHLESICRITGIKNHLEDMYDLPISAITRDDLARIIMMKEFLPMGFSLVKWEEDDAVEYYKDIFRELMGDFNSLIYTVRESLGTSKR